MIDYEYRDLFNKDSVKKDFLIGCLLPDNSIYYLRNADLYQGEFELNESLCSENQLTFGSCESCSVKFKTANKDVPSLIGAQITINIILETAPNQTSYFLLGVYTVDSDKLTADRKAREIVAYDRMKRLYSLDAKAWYDQQFVPSGNLEVVSIQMASFRSSFFRNFGIELDESQANIELANDSIYIKKTLETETILVSDILKAICEINGVFGHYNRKGKFEFVTVRKVIEGLYPSETLYPKNDLYPKDSSIADSWGASHYIKAEYESYKCKKIDTIHIYDEEDNVGGRFPTTGNGNNVYQIKNNFLVYGQTTAELNNMCTRLNEYIGGREYRPAKIEKNGNPTLEVGDVIRVATESDIFYTIILERTMKGIQALRDNISAKGVETYPEQKATIQSEIKKIATKASVLTRTNEKLESAIYETDEQGQQISRITQTATALEAEISNRETAVATAQLTATDFSLRISGASDSVYDELTYTIKYRGVGSPATSVKTPSANEYFLNLENGHLFQYRSQPNGSYKWEDTGVVLQKLCKLSTEIKSTREEVSAKASKTYENGSQTFGWTLTSSQFTIKGDGKEVFKCTSSGATIGSGSYKWTIGQSTVDDKTYASLYSNSKSTFASNATGVYLGTDGIKLGSAFSVDNSGNLKCSNAEIKGKIEATELNVTNATITGTLSAAHITDGTITSGKIASGAVTSTQINSGAVTSSKLGQNSVNTNALQQSAVYDKLTDPTREVVCSQLKVGQNGTQGNIVFYEAGQGVSKYVRIYAASDGTVKWVAAN